MGAASFLFGKTEAETYAERQRTQAEDALMAVHPMERNSLDVHCTAEAERAMVFLTRLRDIQAISHANSKRNLVATILVGAVLLMAIYSTTGSLHGVGEAISKIAVP